MKIYVIIFSDRHVLPF